jgi:hypothetical protein
VELSEIVILELPLRRTTGSVVSSFLHAVKSMLTARAASEAEIKNLLFIILFGLGV